MTREEAIAILQTMEYELSNQVGSTYCRKKYDAVRIAIKALEQEPCEDCISRQAVINEMEKRHAKGDCITKGFIKNLPSVTPQEPRKGHWIEERNDYGEIMQWHCSNCYDNSGFTTTCKWDYCPNCGADMREVEE